MLQVNLARIFVVLLPDFARVDDVELRGRRNGVLKLSDGEGDVADNVVAAHVVVVEHLHLDLPVQVAVAQLARAEIVGQVIEVLNRCGFRCNH